VPSKRIWKLLRIYINTRKSRQTLDEIETVIPNSV